jgi:competence protein ComEC
MLALTMGLALAHHPEAAALAGTGVAAALVLFTHTAARGAVRAPAVAVLAAACAGTMLGGARLAAIDRSDLVSLAGREVALRGFVIRREHPVRGMERFRVRTAIVAEGRRRMEVSETVQVRLAARAPRVVPAIGDEVEARGTLERPWSRPGARFDYASYLARAGVHTVLEARAVRLTGGRRGGVAGAVDAVRRRAESGVSSGLDPPLAALARGMVLGQDERIAEAMRNDFNGSGLAHVLAVSGQNVTLLAILAWALLGALGLGRRGRLVATVGLIVLYVPLTGAGPSIVRAGVMGAAGVVAGLAGRPSSRWYALLAAGAVSLALDPRAWQDVGWQLSFAAVAGIFVLAPAFRRRLRRLPEPLPEGAALTVAATVATAPLMAVHFGRVSLAALPANLVALPAIAPVMWIGMLSAALAQVWLAPATLLNALNGFLLAFTASVAHWFAGSPGATWNIGQVPPAAAAAAYGALAGLVALAHAAGRREAPGARSAPGADAARRARRASVATPAAALCLVFLLVLALAGLLPSLRRSPPGPPAGFTASFLDVGQGDATLIQAPGGVAVLVDGGPAGSGAAASLRKRGVGVLDAVVLTHAQADHQGGLEEVLRKVPVRLLLDGGAGARDRTHRRILRLAHRQGTRVTTASAGERLRLGGLRMEVMSPDGPPGPGSAGAGEDPNLRAIVLLASYRGLDLFLPADAESEVTSGLPLRPVEVVKVAHHGSRDEGLAGLLERLEPRAAVIEVGARNRYGHPDPATVATLRRSVPHVYRTDRDGEVTVTLGAGGPRVVAERR